MKASIPFDFSQESEKTDEKEEFKVVSASLKVGDTSQSPRPSMKRANPLTSREKDKKVTCILAVYETGREIDKLRPVTTLLRLISILSMIMQKLKHYCFALCLVKITRP